MPKEGWYQDPTDDLQHRYWDGEKWTTQTRPLLPPETPNVALPPPAPTPSSQPSPPHQTLYQSHTSRAVPRPLLIAAVAVAAVLIIGGAGFVLSKSSSPTTTTTTALPSRAVQIPANPPAWAIGDAQIARYMMPSPLAGATAGSASEVQPFITLVDTEVNRSLSGGEFAKTAMSLWVVSSNGNEVVDEMVAFSGAVPSPSATLNEAVSAGCSGTATPTSDSAVAGAVEGHCSSGKIVIGWIKENVMTLILTTGATSAQANSDASTQDSYLPASGVAITK
jgi:uncharacterized membrane protein